MSPTKTELAVLINVKEKTSLKVDKIWDLFAMKDNEKGKPEVKETAPAKVSPHQLYDMAHGDVEQYAKLMRAHGYLMRKDSVSLEKVIDVICIQRHGQKDEPGQRKAYTPLAAAILEIL